MIEVAGFFTCDVDRESFFAQQAPLYPGKYQRWVIVLPDWGEPLTEQYVKRRVSLFMQNAGLGTWDYRGVKVLGFSTKQPDKWARARSVVSPIPEFKSAPVSDEPAVMFYVAIEFWYDGDEKSIPWPWMSRGFIIKCPEDTTGGLMAVMPPVAAMAPPTFAEELERPLREAAITIHDKVAPVIRETGEALGRLGEGLEKPAREVGSALTFLLWGAVGIGLWHLHKSAESGRKRLLP